jgi:hypothetical protein
MKQTLGIIGLLILTAILFFMFIYTTFKLGGLMAERQLQIQEEVWNSMN